MCISGKAGSGDQITEARSGVEIHILSAGATFSSDSSGFLEAEIPTDL